MNNNKLEFTQYTEDKIIPASELMESIDPKQIIETRYASLVAGIWIQIKSAAEKNLRSADTGPTNEYADVVDRAIKTFTSKGYVIEKSEENYPYLKISW